MKFRIKNLSLSISVYFAAVITFALIFSPDSGILQTLLFCVLHEAGHIAAIKIFRGSVEGISLGAYGMRIDSKDNLRISPVKEIIIFLSGPSVNLLIAFFGLLLHIDDTVRINLCLAVFNLLPAGKTDGANALYTFFTVRYDEITAKNAVKKTGYAFSVLIFMTGMLIFIKTGFNFSLFAAGIYIGLMNILS